MTRLLLVLVLVFAPLGARADISASDPGFPRAGDRFFLHVDAIGALRQGDVFDVLDDRYTDISLKARVVSIEGDTALIEIVSGQALPPLASAGQPTFASASAPR